MNKNQFYKTGWVAVCAILLSSTILADMVGSTATLAEIATMSGQAKLNLAIAAIGGDVNGIAEAAKRADAVDAALAEAQEAVAEQERSLAAGDEDNAAAAEQAAGMARQKAYDALYGAVPEGNPGSKHAQWKESQENTGGGPGRPFDPPQFEDTPRKHFKKLFGQGRGLGDRPATPE